MMQTLQLLLMLAVLVGAAATAVTNYRATKAKNPASQVNLWATSVKLTAALAPMSLIVAGISGNFVWVGTAAAMAVNFVMSFISYRRAQDKVEAGEGVSR